MNPEYVGEMTPEEETWWKVWDMQNGRTSEKRHPAPLPDEAMAGEQEVD